MSFFSWFIFNFLVTSLWHCRSLNETQKHTHTCLVICRQAKNRSTILYSKYKLEFSSFVFYIVFISHELWMCVCVFCCCRVHWNRSIPEQRALEWAEQSCNASCYNEMSALTNKQLHYNTNNFVHVSFQLNFRLIFTSHILNHAADSSHTKNCTCAQKKENKMWKRKEYYHFWYKRNCKRNAYNTRMGRQQPFGLNWSRVRCVLVFVAHFCRLTSVLCIIIIIFWKSWCSCNFQTDVHNTII